MSHSIAFNYYTNTVHYSNDDRKIQVDEPISRVNESITTLSSAVRTLIGQRNLTSLKKTIKSEKGLYDGLRNESDGSIDSLHEKRRSLRGTNQNEQNITLPIELYKKSQQNPEDSISPFPDRASSLDDNVDAPRNTLSTRDSDIIRFDRENPSNSKDNTDLAWKTHDLLSLGCTIFSAKLLIMLTLGMDRRRWHP